jgi:hypothetical protein
LKKGHVIRETASQTEGSTEEIRIVRRPNFLAESYQIGHSDSDFESADEGLVHETAVPGSELDVSMSSFHDDISDEIFEVDQQQKEKQEKAEADAKNMLQSIYRSSAEKLVASSSKKPIKKATITKNTKKGSNKAGTGEAPMSMDVDVVEPEIQSKKAKDVGSTGDPDGPVKRGRKPTIKTTDKQATTRLYSRKRTQTPTFQEGGSSSSMAVVEVPPSVNVAKEVKKK